MALSDTSTAVRPAAILTTSYVASEAASIGNSSRVSIDLDFTLASLTSLELMVDLSSGGVWRPYSVVKATNGAVAMYPATFTFLPADWGTSATGTSILLEVAAEKIRVRAKGTGTLTACSLTVTVAEGNAA
jgi:hypothetical protein